MKKLIKLILNFFKKENVCLFLGSTDILPPPLSNEEETRLLILSKEGDNEARNKLIEHNIRLVVFLAKKYENTKLFMVNHKFKFDDTYLYLEKQMPHKK